MASKNAIVPAKGEPLETEFAVEAGGKQVGENEVSTPNAQTPSKRRSNSFVKYESAKNFSEFKSFKMKEEEKRGTLWQQFLDFLHPKLLDEEQEENLEEFARSRVIPLLASTRMLKERLSRKNKLVTGSMYLFFMLVFFYIVIAQRKVSNSFKLEYALSSQLSAVEDSNDNTYQDVSTYEELLDWMETGLLPEIFPPQVWYNGDYFTDFEKSYFLEYNRIVGGLKFGQRRIDPKLCYHNDTEVTSYFHENYEHAKSSPEVCSSRFNEYYPILYPPYSVDTKSSAPFGPSYDHSKFTWENDEYNGGFFVYTVADSKLAYKIIEELRQNKWLDKSTRTVEVSFGVYNGNYKMFTTVSMVFQLLATGLITKKIKMGTFMIEHYLTTDDKVRMGFEILFMIYIFASVIGEFQEFYYRSFGERAKTAKVKEYFSSFWNWIDLARIFGFIASTIGWFCILYHYVAVDLTLPLPADSIYYDFEPLASLHRTQEIINSGTVIVCLLTCFKYAHYSPKFGILVLTIIKALPDLMQFLYMFITCFFVFNVMGMMMFGSNLEEWSTFYKGMQTLVMMLTAEYGLGPLVAIDANKGMMFYFLFLVIAYFLLVNILLAILLDAYTALREENANRDEREADSLTFSVPSEVIGEFRFRVLRVINKLFGMQKGMQTHTFITTEEMLSVLEDHPEMLDLATMVPGKKTVMNPNPEPEFLVTFVMLLKCCPVQRARLMMAAIGQAREEEEEEEEDEVEEKKKRQSHHEEVEDAVKASRRVSEMLDEKVSGLMQENAYLKTEIKVMNDKLDMIVALVKPPSPPVRTPEEGEMPDPHSRHATYNAIYNSIYRNID